MRRVKNPRRDQQIVDREKSARLLQQCAQIAKGLYRVDGRLGRDFRRLAL